MAFGLALLSLLVALPVFLIEGMPPLMDVPNHLVRLWLIQGAIDTEPFNRFWMEDWHNIATNIAIDLLAKPFAGLLPPFLVGKLLIVLAMLLPPLGGVALNASVTGGLKPWHFIFLLFWCSITMLAGFLNYQIGLGAALLGGGLGRAAEAGCLGAGLQGARIALGVLLIVDPCFCASVLCRAAGRDWRSGP